MLSQFSEVSWVKFRARAVPAGAHYCVECEQPLPYSERGFGIVEIIAVLGLSAIMLGMAISNLKVLNDPLQNNSQQMMGFIKQVRAKAIATTSAYTITAPTRDRLVASSAANCDDPAPTLDPNAYLDLEQGAELASVAFSLCFNTRGLPSANTRLYLRGEQYHYKTVEVMLGGAVRIE